MKKKIFIPYIILIVIMALAFTGCSDDAKDKEPDKNDLGKPVDFNEKDEDIIEEFRIIKKTSPAPDLLIDFIDENIGKVSTEEADEMIDSLEALLEKNTHVYGGKISELDKDNELLKIDGDKKEFQRKNIKKIEDEKLKVEIEYLYSNMYKLINSEGEFYRTIDYSKLKVYSPYLSENLKKYIEVRSLESDNRFMIDGELTIGFEELADRIFKTEDYLKVASKYKRKEDMLKEYEYKISAYLKGLPNSPIMDYESKEINKEVLESYKKTMDKEYEISHIVKDYIEFIRDRGNIIDEVVLEKADELIVKALYDVAVE